jgi:hypothetical protein
MSAMAVNEVVRHRDVKRTSKLSKALYGLAILSDSGESSKGESGRTDKSEFKFIVPNRIPTGPIGCSKGLLPACHA